MNQWQRYGAIDAALQIRPNASTDPPARMFAPIATWPAAQSVAENATPPLPPTPGCAVMLPIDTVYALLAWLAVIGAQRSTRLPPG
jgi:hypothetical protein